MDEPKQRTREVHDTLLPVLSEMHGDQLRVKQARDTGAGLVAYRFESQGVPCEAGATVISDRAAGVLLTARLGRCYVGYRRALRWLAANRSHNTVVLMAHPEVMVSRELWVTSHRVTMPGDADGIREMLRDFAAELVRLRFGLQWFPQLLEGKELEEIEDAIASGNEAVAAIVASPQSYCQRVKENPVEALNGHGGLPARVFGWLGRWADRLEWMDRHWTTLSQSEQQDDRIGFLLHKAVSLAELDRHGELLAIMDELDPMVDDEQWVQTVAWRIRALCGLGRHDEALEAVRAAQYDVHPHVWYWRSVAQASLGQYAEAVASFERYENVVGLDVIGRRQLGRLIPDDWQSEQMAA